MAKTKVTGEYLKDSVVRFTAKAGENITKGNAVYISGISGELPVVSLADADDTAKMPAFGLAEATVSTNAEVEVTSFGTLADLDTSSYTLGDILYVGTTAGALTNDPAGLEATKLQNIGIVQRVHASNGSIKVGGAGRTNAVPNLDDGDIFIGDSNNKAVSSALSTEIESYLDGGTSTPTFASATVSGDLTATNIAGTLTTAAQTNITSVGTLSSLTVSGDLTVDTNRLYVDSTNDRVGIALSTPPHRFSVGSANDDGIALYDGTNDLATIFRENNDQARFSLLDTGTVKVRLSSKPSDANYINNGGNLGIGTTSPDAALDIQRTNDTSNTNVPTLRFTDADTSSQAGQKAGQIEFFTSDTTPGPIGVHSFINGQTESTSGLGALVFGTGQSGSASEKVRIDSSGNVGIGTSSPDRALKIHQDNAYVWIADAAGGNVGFIGGSGANDGLMRLYEGTGHTAKVEIHSNSDSYFNGGNVGIGTTNPEAKFHVDDNTVLIGANASGYATLNFHSQTAGSARYGSIRKNWDSPFDMRIRASNSTGDVPLIFETSSVNERMRILAGGGITFNGDTAAANALDDYEEGTWTATISGTSGATATWSSGYYTKIGNMVFANFALSVNSQVNGDNYVVLTGPFVQHQNNITWTGYCTNYSFGDRRSGIIINNSSGNGTQWYVGWKSNSTAAANIRGTIVYQTT